MWQRSTPQSISEARPTTSMDASRVLFWGVELTPGKPIPFDLNEGEVLHINMASLGESLQDKTGRSVVTARVADDSPKFALCALTAGKMESFNLDITFSGEEKVELEVSGKNVVHLVGNFGFDGEEEGSDMFGDSDDLINEYSDDESQDAGSSSEEEPMLLEDDDPPVITEIMEDAGAKANGKPSKAEKKKQRKKKAEEAAAAAAASVADDDDNDGGDSEENVGRTGKKAATPEAPKSGGKKRANVADAGQTPAAKKSRGSASEGSGASGKKPSAKKEKASKAENDAAQPEKASEPAAAKPKGGSRTPATPEVSATPSGTDGESAKKRKRRRSKGKGGAGPSA